MSNKARTCMYLDINVGTEPIGRLVVKLFRDKVPKTCENFRALCTELKRPLSYNMVPLHRTNRNSAIQGGDTTNCDETGGISTYGDTFKDENIGWKEIDSAGLVCMTNSGKDTNGSQFLITLAPCPQLAANHTVLGQLISSQNVVNRILEVPVDSDDRPTVDILIARCGELELGPKATQICDMMSSDSRNPSEDRGRLEHRRPSSHSPTRAESPSRGHTRDSGSRHQQHHRKHHHASSSPSPSPPERCSRRRSDASLDHNLRGRPRGRSRQRTRSPIRESLSSQRSRHKRSPPPSRRRECKEGGMSPDRRRQRSLPNLYTDDDSSAVNLGSRNMTAEELKRLFNNYDGLSKEVNHTTGANLCGEVAITPRGVLPHEGKGFSIP